MTAEAFRRIALSFPDTVEHSDVDHPDFRAGGKIFAMLGCPDEEWASLRQAYNPGSAICMSPSRRGHPVRSEADF